MIPKDEFYTKDDYPTRQQTEGMWSAVKKSLFPSTSFWRPDTRSFVYGMAASVILMFAAIGAYTTVKSVIEHSQPQAIKVDKAYQSAIREFERVALQSLTGNQPSPGNGLALTRKEQLRLLNQAINDLKQETSSNDLSPLKQARLRELYSLKLKVLQEMIEQGEIEL